MKPVLDPALVEKEDLATRDLPGSTYALLERGAEHFAGRVAHVLPAGRGEPPEPVTHEELLGRVTRVANALHRLGVTRRDPIGLLGPNTGELLTATLAAEAVAIAQPINPALDPETIEAMIRLAGTTVLIAAGPEISPQLWASAVRLGERAGLAAVLALRPVGAREDRPALTGAGTGTKVAYLEELAADEPSGHLVAERPGPDDIAAYFHTGGTTGTPKLAAHTHANEVFVAWGLDVTSEDPDLTMFSGLPMFHVNAVLISMISPAYTGARVVWAGPLGFRDPELYPAFWQLVERYRISFVNAVPSVYARLAQVPVDADLSSLKFVVSGAAPLSDSIREAFERHTSVPICDGYGLTEAGGVSARIRPGHPRRGSAGLRLPYQRMRAVSVTGGRPLPPGETGIITIDGPGVFPGYVTVGPDGARTLDPMGKVAGGWLDTGDLGHVDADGYLYLTGRLKDVIIRGGHNIDPALVEDSLLSHPDVTGASAVGRPDAYAGEVPVCYVSLRPGATVTSEELVAWAAGHVAEAAAAPKAVYVMAELPVTAVGKDFKPALRADVVRRVVLAEVPGVDVVVRIEDGTPVATIRADDSQTEAIGAALASYSFAWRIVPPSEEMAGQR
ncbi:acyl-CoA synthetase [Actinoplanes sp. NPDC049596]|uniref:acyl-CoA synthetase n=1 Tax=unclassified Actinoplanes TaxID=2626549 RepID=UPI003433E5CD